MSNAVATKRPISRQFYGTPGEPGRQPVPEGANVNYVLDLIRESVDMRDPWHGSLKALRAINDAASWVNNQNATKSIKLGPEAVRLADLLEGRAGSTVSLTLDELNDQFDFAENVMDRISDLADLALRGD